MSGNGATRFEELLAVHARGAHRSPINDYFSDPYRFFTWVRAEEPVLYVPEIDHWAVSRFHDLTRVLRDQATFSSANNRHPVVPLCARAKEAYESSGVRLEPALVDEDPPTHRDHRRLFGRGFSVRRVERLARISHQGVGGHKFSVSKRH